MNEARLLSTTWKEGRKEGRKVEVYVDNMIDNNGRKGLSHNSKRPHAFFECISSLHARHRLALVKALVVCY